MIPAITVGIVLFFIVSCKDKKPDVIDAVENRTVIPSLHANEITTIISDSGVTRYRITASVFDMYDKADPPYWEFPEGIYLERFDTDLNVDANIKSDYAKYYEKESLWELKRNVDATNLQGERFETERLFWDEKLEKIYSDTIVKITQPGQVLYAMDFVSNQSLSQYEMTLPHDGIILIKDEE